MDPITQALESINLAPIFFAAVLFAAVISVVVMQWTSKARINSGDPVWVQNVHRLLFIGIAVSFVWMFSFAWDKAWQPWPPFLVFVLLYDALMLLRAYVIHRTAEAEEKLRAPAAFPHRTI